MHDSLTFVKHIYIDMNIDVNVLRQRYVQQD
jgi:hypothetical protein